MSYFQSQNRHDGAQTVICYAYHVNFFSSWTSFCDPRCHPWLKPNTNKIFPKLTTNKGWHTPSNSQMCSTQSSASKRCIHGQYRAARIHEQSITWGGADADSENATSFDVTTILVYCTCKYFDNTTRANGLCCSHIIGQLRRTIYLTTSN